MPAPALRAFTVHFRGEDAPRHARHVEEASFEAAALAFIEDRHLDSPDEAVSVIVQDTDNGREQCFRIDLDTGEASACA